MSNAVITVTIGEEFHRIAAITHPLIAFYARRIGADFVVLQGAASQPWFEKFRLYDFLGLYERVLFLDTDVIVQPTCPNLFDRVPAERFGAWLASRHYSRFDPQIARIQQVLPDLGWRGDYFNSGVMVVSRCHRDAFSKSIEYEDEYPDQTLLNYRVQRLRYPIEDIGYRFNHTRLVDGGAGRFASHIIHYAGVGPDRAAAILADLPRLGLLRPG
jgi:lipopolysaccharide biosynthesis glycosyltransferase